VSMGPFANLGGVGRAGLVSGVVVLATVAFLGYRSMPLFAAAGATGAEGAEKGAAAERVERYSKSLDRDLAAFNGRSLFYIPSPPPPKYVPPPPRVDRPVEPVKPTAPPPPATYGGPKIIGAVSGYVWFDNGKKLAVGGAGEGGLRVIAVSEVPWAARLSWNGVEFDVPFIAKDTVVMSGKGMKGIIVGTTAPAPEAPKPAPKKEEKPDIEKP